MLVTNKIKLLPNNLYNFKFTVNVNYLISTLGRGNSMIHVIQFPKSKFKKNVFAARKREPPPRLPWCYLPVRNNTLCECWSVAFNPSSVFWCKFEFILKRFSFLAVVFLWVSWGGGGLRRGGSYLCQTQWAN